MVSSSGDRTACIWDRRKLGPGVKALHSVTATNVILSAYFSPDGSCLQPSLLLRILHVQCMCTMTEPHQGSCMLRRACDKS